MRSSHDNVRHTTGLIIADDCRLSIGVITGVAHQGGRTTAGICNVTGIVLGDSQIRCIRSIDTGMRVQTSVEIRFG